MLLDLTIRYDSVLLFGVGILAKMIFARALANY